MLKDNPTCRDSAVVRATLEQLRRSTKASAYIGNGIVSSARLKHFYEVSCGPPTNILASTVQVC